VRRLLAPALALLTLALLLGAGADEPPMTNEEVVRRVAAGEDPASIEADVARRLPAFDLSDEMRAELLRAGVSERLLGAMERRAREAAPPEAPKPPEPLPPVTAGLRLVASEEAITLSRNLGPQRVAELDLPAGALQADALALVAACVASGHRDPPYARWPEGTLPKKTVKGARPLAVVQGVPSGERRLRVPLRPAVEVPLTPGVSHDVLLVLLVRSGGRWGLLGLAELRGARVAEGGWKDVPLEVRSLPGSRVGLEMRSPSDAALPDLPRSQGWARGASLAAAGVRSGAAVSPDGRKRLVVGPESLRLEIEGRQVPEVELPRDGEVEVLWAPDSNAVAVTTGGAQEPVTRAWRIEPDEAVHAIPLDGTPGTFALAFPDGGGRLLLASRRDGRLTGAIVRVSDGTVAGRLTELELRTRFKDRLGPRLR
jgi:hypothetical protein